MPDVDTIKPSASPGRTALDFAIKNFAPLSALAALVAYLTGTVFLYSYLSFFDWRLIWFVEYSDVIKFGLVAFAFLSSFGAFLWAIGQDAAEFRKETGKTVYKLIRAVGISFLVGAVFWLAREYSVFLKPQYTFWVLIFAAQYTTFATVMLVTRSLSQLEKYSGRDALGDVFMIFVTASVLGLAFAAWVRDTDGFEHDVVVDGQLLEKVGVVFITSHHTVLYANDLATVVPTDKITRMKARTSVPRQRYSDLKRQQHLERQRVQSPLVRGPAPFVTSEERLPEYRRWLGCCWR